MTRDDHAAIDKAYTALTTKVLRFAIKEGFNLDSKIALQRAAKDIQELQRVHRRNFYDLTDGAKV